MHLDIDQLHQLFMPLFPGLMGIRFIVLTPERVVAELAVRPDLCTTGCILHGGAIMAFADTLGAVGTALCLDPGKGQTTIDSSTSFIKPASVHTTVTGESIALHRGRTTMVWQTSIRTGDGTLCAVVTQTQLILDADLQTAA